MTATPTMLRFLSASGRIVRFGLRFLSDTLRTMTGKAPKTAPNGFRAGTLDRNPPRPAKPVSGRFDKR